MRLQKGLSRAGASTNCPPRSTELHRGPQPGQRIGEKEPPQQSGVSWRAQRGAACGCKARLVNISSRRAVPSSRNAPAVRRHPMRPRPKQAAQGAPCFRQHFSPSQVKVPWGEPEDAPEELPLAKEPGLVLLEPEPAPEPEVTAFCPPLRFGAAGIPVRDADSIPAVLVPALLDESVLANVPVPALIAFAA